MEDNDYISILDDAINNHRPYFLQHPRRILRSESAVEDVFSEALLNAWKFRHCFDPKKSSFKTWLRHIVVNKTFDYLRKNKFRIMENVSEDTIVVENISVDEDVLFAVNGIVSKMEPVEQEIIFLRFGRDVKMPHIAASLNNSETKIKTRNNRCLKKIRIAYRKLDESFTA